MKKKLISAAILLGVSTIAFADEKTPMSLNKDGLGQVLIYPYYNVNAGFDTAFTIVNTHETARAVKVRIIEGKNSWEVLDFNLYMSPYDTWQGMLHRSGDEIKILTADRSCTAPWLMDDKENPPYLRRHNLTDIEAVQGRKTSLFSGKVYKSDDQREAEYADPVNILNRMSEGYIEVIDMGQLTDTGLIATTEAKGPSLKEVQEANKEGKKIKNACDAFAEKFKDEWNDNPDEGILTDGQNALTGTATIIHVDKGMAGSYNAVAIKNFVNKEPDKRTPGKAYTLHTFPGASYPNLNGQVQRGKKIQYVETLNHHALVAHNGGGLSKPIEVNKARYLQLESGVPGQEQLTYNVLEKAKETGRTDEVYPGAVTLSAVLMTKEIIGEYVIEPLLSAATDWIITMPTKHFFTNPDTSQKDTDHRGLGQYGFIADVGETGDYKGHTHLEADKDPAQLLTKTPAYMPFTNTAFSTAPLVEKARMTIYDREETPNTVDYKLDFSPSLGIPSTGMNAEANVLQFGHNDQEKVFESINAHNLKIKDNFVAGWALIDFKDQFLSDAYFDPTRKVDDLCNTTSMGALQAKGNYCLRGLPAIGIAVTKYFNGEQYQGSDRTRLLSNYIGITDLTYKRDNEIQENEDKDEGDS